MGANREALKVDFRPMNIDDLASVFLNEQGAYKFPWSIGIFSDCLKAGYDCQVAILHQSQGCLLYTSPSPRDGLLSRMPSSA